MTATAVPSHAMRPISAAARRSQPAMFSSPVFGSASAPAPACPYRAERRSRMPSGTTTAMHSGLAATAQVRQVPADAVASTARSISRPHSASAPARHPASCDPAASRSPRKMPAQSTAPDQASGSGPRAAAGGAQAPNASDKIPVPSPADDGSDRSREVKLTCPPQAAGPEHHRYRERQAGRGEDRDEHVHDGPGRAHPGAAGACSRTTSVRAGAAPHRPVERAGSRQAPGGCAQPCAGSAGCDAGQLGDAGRLGPGGAAPPARSRRIRAHLLPA